MKIDLIEYIDPTVYDVDTCERYQYIKQLLQTEINLTKLLITRIILTLWLNAY